MNGLRIAPEWERAARREVDKLVAAHGRDAWGIAVERAWESGDYGQWHCDYWWRVARIAERRLGIVQHPDACGSEATRGTPPPV